MRSDSKSLPEVSTAAGAARGAVQRLLLVAAVAMLAACSAGMRLSYNNADTLLLYSAARYVTLTPEQEALVRERTAALLAWHRATQLPDYVALLGNARGKLAGTVTPQDVLAFNDAINARLALVGERAAPDLAQLARSLTPDQVAQLQRKFAESTEKEEREARAAARPVAASADAARARIDDRVNKMVERTTDWFGSVNAEQRALLQAAAARSIDDPAAWPAERERRQQALLAMLKRMQHEQPDAATATAWIRTYLAQLRTPADAARRAQLQAMRTTNAELVASLINAASPEQRALLSRKLTGLANDFTALAAGRSALSPG